jgi:hypothetical protein
MYHPSSKRKELIQRIAIYTVMCTAIAGLVVALVFFMLGYQFNKSDGKIEQGGLVQFDSRPNGADVSIDGANLGARTPSKVTLGSGSHFISMQRSGYKTWQKSVSVVPGSVLWLNYARLVPTDIKPAAVSSFATVTSSIASPDSKWMAIKTDPTLTQLQLADLTQDDVKTKAIDFPAGSFTVPSEGKTQSFSLDSWSPNSRYVLVKHTYDDTKIEWLLIDTQSAAQSKNITGLLAVDISKVEFNPANSNQLYVQIGSDVRRIDINAVTLSGPLVTNVAEFSLYDRSTILFTSLPDPTTKVRTVGYYTDGASKARTIHAYSDNGQIPLHVAVGKYFGDTYVAVAYGATVETSIGDLPASDSTDTLTHDAVSSMTAPDTVSYLSIITNGRFIVAQTTKAYAVYDLEIKKSTTTSVKSDVAMTRELRWLDGYNLWSDQGDVLRMYEFDGANQHDIMPVTQGQDVTLSPNGKYLYGFTHSADGTYQLQRVQMIL